MCNVQITLYKSQCAKFNSHKSRCAMCKSQCTNHGVQCLIRTNHDVQCANHGVQCLIRINQEVKERRVDGSVVCLCLWISISTRPPTNHSCCKSNFALHIALCVLYISFSVCTFCTHCTCALNIAHNAMLEEEQAGRRDSITILIPTPTMGVPCIRGGRITCVALNTIDHWTTFDLLCF